MFRKRDQPRLWRATFAVVGWTALALQYLLMVAPVQGWTVLERTINYFSFFTILTNVLVAAAFTGPLLQPGSRLARWSASEGVRAAVAMYIVVVGVVYHVLLHPYWSPTGWSLAVNLVLHYVMPAAFVLDWLWLTPKGRLRWIDPVKWLSYPLLYGVFTAVHGQIVGWYPYWFIDIGALGWGPALVNFAALLSFFLILGLIVAALDRGLAALGKGDSSLTPS